MGKRKKEIPKSEIHKEFSELPIYELDTNKNLEIRINLLLRPGKPGAAEAQSS